MSFFDQMFEQQGKRMRQGERVPLSVLNGNQKPQRTKDLLEINQYPTTFEQNVGKCNLALPFSIFADEESSSSTIVKEEKSNDVPRRLTTLQSFSAGEYESFNKPVFYSPEVENRPVDVSKEKATNYLEFESPYKEDNFAHLRKVELKYRPNPNYMNAQIEVTNSMRSILVDWLVEVGLQFEFSSEAVHLAVSLTDRFLSCTTVSKNKLQLVGIACLFITAKYEEVVAQELKMYAWITDSTYTKKQILRMEQLIMHRLHFYVGGPTALSFAHLAYSMSRVPKKVLFLAQYLCELSLLDTEPFLSYLPSQIGVAACCLARYILEYTMWSDELENTGYTLEDLKPAINSLFAKIHSTATQLLGSITQKYSHPDFLRVAELEPPEILIMCD